MKRAAIITASDSGYRGEREDLSGPAIREILEREGYEVISMDILPDDQVMLAGKLQEIADSEKAELILTTGGIPEQIFPHVSPSQPDFSVLRTVLHSDSHNRMPVMLQKDLQSEVSSVPYPYHRSICAGFQ